jgi:hypothetical protein
VFLPIIYSEGGHCVNGGRTRHGGAPYPDEPPVLSEPSGAGARPVPHSRHFAATPDVGRFSNRPFRVKRLQTVQYHLRSRCLSRARASLRNRHKALPLWSSMTRWNNLSGGLTVRRMAGPSDQTNSPHPRPARDIFPPIGGARVFSYYICSCAVVMLLRPPGSSGTRFRQARCGVGSRQADVPAPRSPLFIPRCLAICIAQALSQDHLLVRVSMTWAAS